MFCFIATAGREESQARQPSAESFAGKKILILADFLLILVLLQSSNADKNAGSFHIYKRSQVLCLVHHR